MWDKSYYGYNRTEAAENEKAWQEEVRNDFERQALPKVWIYVDFINKYKNLTKKLIN